MPQINARIITKNDYDFNWQNSDLVLQPGELAISIPTREAEAGETPIDGTSRVQDTSKDIVIKIGNNDTFYKDAERLIPNGTAGILCSFASQGGAFEENINTPIELYKNELGQTEIKIRQANKDTTAQEPIYNSGVVSEKDYEDIRTITDFFRSGNDYETDRVTTESLEGKAYNFDETIEKDTNTGKYGVSGNIIWQCNENL